MQSRKLQRAKNAREIAKAGAGARTYLVKAAREALDCMNDPSLEESDWQSLEVVLNEAIRPFAEVDCSEVLCVTNPREFRLTNAEAFVWWHKYVALNPPQCRDDRLTCRLGHGVCSTEPRGLCSDLILESHPNMEDRSS